jgi:uncharacterized protein (DUF736 family)
MAYEMKDGQASLFKNKRKETENHPDYTGSIMLEGVEHWLSAWIKTPKAGGDKYMSLSVGKPKEQRNAPREQPRAQDNPTDFNDEIPF